MTTQFNPETYEMQIKDLEIYAYHGAFAEEKRLGQRFLVDLHLNVRSKGDLGLDSLDNVLSYAEVVKRVHTLFRVKAYSLLETVANEVLLELASFSEIVEAKIRVTKISPPIPFTMGGVSVCLRKKY